MIRLYIFVEGQTEEGFVRKVLAPHLACNGVNDTRPIIVGTSRTVAGIKHKGGGNWGKWRRDISNVLRDQRKQPDLRVSTLFDLYGLPGDFPELKTHRTVPDTVVRAGLLEDAMAAEFSDHRFIPYLQRHEFEALVLACLDDLKRLVVAKEDQDGVARLQDEIGDLPPEDINDGTNSAPSKRLIRHVPCYRKSVHGPQAVQTMGIEALTKRCSRFAAWVNRLEELAR